MNPRLLIGLVVANLVAVVALSISSVYSAYVSSQSHHAACARADAVVEAVHDVIVTFLTPQPGQKLTVQQRATIQLLEDKVFSRLDEATC